MSNNPEVDAVNLTQAQLFEREGMQVLFALVGEERQDAQEARRAIHDRVSPAIQLFHVAGHEAEAERLLGRALPVATKAGASEEDLYELAHGLERARFSVETGLTWADPEAAPEVRGVA